MNNEGHSPDPAPAGRFSSEQLAAGHVAYALTRLKVLPALTVDSSLPADARDACLESYFTNMRLCVEFFARDPDRQGRDFHATDYVPGWSSESTRLNELWDFTSQNVSHFSRKRLPGSDGFVLQSIHPVVLAAHADRVFDIAVEFTEQLQQYEWNTGVTLGCAFTFATALEEVGRVVPDGN